MTKTPEPIDDEIWQASFDWLMAVESAPDDANLRAGLEQWLSLSPRHAEAYRQVQQVWEVGGLLSDDKAQAVEPTTVSRGEDAPSALPPAAVPLLKTGMSRRRWLAGAGALTVGALAYAASGGVEDALADYATGAGEAKVVSLDDGSRLMLDTQTAINVDFSNARRDVALLHGRAYFEVAPDTARLFVVAAGHARVGALGTRFDLRLDPDHVTLSTEQGGASLRFGASEWSLGPAERIRVDRRTGDVSRAAVDDMDALTSWRRGQLTVDDWLVADVLKELERYYPGRIVLADGAFGALRVSGVYNSDAPVDAVRAVARSYGGDVTRIGPWLLLVTRG